MLMAAVTDSPRFFDDINLLRERWQSSNTETVAELYVKSLGRRGLLSQLLVDSSTSSNSTQEILLIIPVLLPSVRACSVKRVRDGIMTYVHRVFAWLPADGGSSPIEGLQEKGIVYV